jgi:hypothetical protein
MRQISPSIRRIHSSISRQINLIMMMKNILFKSIFLAALFSVLMITSCSRDSFFEETAPALQEATQKPTPETGGDLPESCTVSGPTQYWHAWVDDMEAVLNDCHVETLPSHCQYWSPSTSATITHSFEYQSYQVPSGTVNLAISNIASWAQNGLNQPSGNWIVTGYDLYYQNIGYYPRVHVTAYLRRIICNHQVPKK